MDSIDTIIENPNAVPSVPNSPSSPSSSSSFTFPSQDTSSTPRNERNEFKQTNTKRLLNSLSRISSAPSFMKMSKSRPYANKNEHKASISCISLSSSYKTHISTTNSNNNNSELNLTYSTAPTTPTTFTSSKSTAALPTSLQSISPTSLVTSRDEETELYFSHAIDIVKIPKLFDFKSLPAELHIRILSFLNPRELVSCSLVSKSWNQVCFDGQLWQSIDTSNYYRDIPSNQLIELIRRAGPFIKNLNLRGCIQLRDHWSTKNLSDYCKNLINVSLEGCLIDRPSLHDFFNQNFGLVHINLCGLASSTDETMKIISNQCPKLKHLNVTWCTNVTTRGISHVINNCPRLIDLRAGETRCWDNLSFALDLFNTNRLETLLLTNCLSLTDEFVKIMSQGKNGEVDYLTGRIICQPRNLKHFDMSRCRNITDEALYSMAYYFPHLQGLQLSKLKDLTDSSISNFLPTIKSLTHLDLEEIDSLTNQPLIVLSNSTSKDSLRHLSISYCESVNDGGVVPILRNCRQIQSLDMDNTRISDLTLIEASVVIRQRNKSSAEQNPLPSIGSVTNGLRMAVYDCSNVTWNGILEVLSRNAELQRTFNSNYLGPYPNLTNCTSSPVSPSYHHQYISLKAFYTWQPTIVEHSRRVQLGHFDRASRLQRKWAEFMMVGEEAVTQGRGGGIGRRRRRRVRDAMAAMVDETDDQLMTSVVGARFGAMPNNGMSRRRARSEGFSNSGSCIIM